MVAGKEEEEEEEEEEEAARTRVRRLASQKHHVAAEDAEGKPHKADRLNADLAKKGAYNKLQQKTVTGWLGLRNEAANGHYDQYDQAQVEGLVRDVRDFLLRYPA